MDRISYVEYYQFRIMTSYADDFFILSILGTFPFCRGAFMAVTINDIAKKTGISKSTVSRVLMGKGSFSEKNRQRVLAAMEEMQYSPNSVARAMRTGRTGNIAFIICQNHTPAVSHPFYSRILDGTLGEVNRIGYNLIIASENNITDDSSVIFQKRIDGVILASSVRPEIVQMFRRHEIPTVLINNLSDEPDVICVMSDDYGGASDAMEYLIEKGHRRIAFICGYPDHSSYKERHNAYMDVLKRHGLEVDENIIRFCGHRTEEGKAAMEILLRDTRDFTAVFASNDFIAVGAVKALKEAALKIPEDVAVVGFDDLDMAKIIDPELTTVHTDKEQIGIRAVKCLFDIMDKKDCCERVRIQKTRLIVRKST
ncbi:MAG: LacI family DNA-binding transcriptional regulator [Acetanaerobacterium sp.]